MASDHNVDISIGAAIVSQSIVEDSKGAAFDPTIAQQYIGAAVWDLKSASSLSRTPPPPESMVVIDLRNPEPPEDNIFLAVDERTKVDEKHFGPGGKYRCMSNLPFVIYVLC